MGLKQECTAKIDEITQGKKSGHSPLGMWKYDKKGNYFTLHSNPPIANCVQVYLDTDPDHWIWDAVHAAIFRDLGVMRVD